jgi:peptide deformylase
VCAFLNTETHTHTHIYIIPLLHHQMRAVLSQRAVMARSFHVPQQACHHRRQCRTTSTSTSTPYLSSMIVYTVTHHSHHNSRNYCSHAATQTHSLSTLPPTSPLSCCGPLTRRRRESESLLTPHDRIGITRMTPSVSFRTSPHSDKPLDIETLREAVSNVRQSTRREPPFRYQSQLDASGAAGSAGTMISVDSPVPHLPLKEFAHFGTVRKIARIGHPALARQAIALDPHDERTWSIVADLCASAESMAGYAGLAAPQLGISARAFIFRLSVNGFRAYADPNEAHAITESNPAQSPDTANTPAGVVVPTSALLNVSYQPLSDNAVEDWEECFSLPDLTGPVARYDKIQFRGVSLDGFDVVGEAQGYFARVIQHEVDHLDGIVFTERMHDLSRLAFVQEVLEHSSNL